MSNRKVLALSVISVVVLVVAIIATSYATFTANLTGTKENKIQTGYVTMNCAETTMNLQDTQKMTDAQGIAASNNTATCALTTTINGTMKLGYDIGFTEVGGSGLTSSDVKFQAYKTIGSTTGTKAYVGGTSATAGVTFASRASSKGTHVPATITGYQIDSAEVSSTTTVYYTIKTWVAGDGTGSTTTSSNETAHCSNSAYSSESACEGAGEVWGTSQTATQSGGSFSYKLKIASTQTGV